MRYEQIHPGSIRLRGFTLVNKNTGSPITSGTVNYSLLALSGANAGKWWKSSDATWAASEQTLAMTHKAGGHWTIDIKGPSSESPFSDGIEFLEYAQESTSLHVADATMLASEYVPTADSSRRTTVGTNADKTGYALTSAEHEAIANEVEAEIIDETDSEKVLEAIVNKINAMTDLDALTLAAIATAVKDALEGSGHASGLPAIRSQTAAIETDTQDIQGRLPAALVSGRMSANAEVVGDKTGYSISGTLTTLDAVWTKIVKIVRAMLRSDAATTTDSATEIGEINANAGSGAGDYSNQTDSLEAQRDAVAGGTGDASEATVQKVLRVVQSQE